MCGRATETLPHVLSWYSSLAQSKYLNRHNAVLKILFFEMRKDHKLVDSVPSWNWPVTPKPMYESPDVQAYWAVPVYADHTCVKAVREWMCGLWIIRERKSGQLTAVGLNSNEVVTAKTLFR